MRAENISFVVLTAEAVLATTGLHTHSRVQIHYDDEAKECYRLAHVEAVSDPPFIDITDDCVRIGYGSRYDKWVYFDGGLELYKTGEMQRYIKVDVGDCEMEKAELFNAVAVVRFLDKLGIELG